MEIVRGIRDIHTYLSPIFGFETERATHYALENGQIPGAFQLGQRWCLEKNTFTARILEMAGKTPTDSSRSPDQRLAAQAEDA